jgi:hypothetical protein
MLAKTIGYGCKYGKADMSNHETHTIVVPRTETQTYHDSRLGERMTLSIFLSGPSKVETKACVP